MNDWENQLAMLLKQQDQPQEDYWGMMAANNAPPALVGQNEKLMNAYINQIQGGQQSQQLTPQQIQQQALQNQTARQGLAPQTPAQIQAKQLAEIMRRRGLPSQ